MIISQTCKEITPCKTATHTPAMIIEMKTNDIYICVSKEDYELDF